MLTFRGYPRKTGPAGIRNTVLVISGDLCCNPWSRDIAARVDNCYALTHKHGVGNYAPDRDLFKRLVSGVTVNPNVYGFVFVSSGNEDHPNDEILERAEMSGKPFHVVSAKREPSGASVVRKGIRYAETLVRDAAHVKPSAIPIDNLVVGLNCAGTDTVSAETVHPVCGAFADRLVDLGGTVIVGETPDLIGLGELLFGRCVWNGDRRRLERFYVERRAGLAATGENIDDIEMVAFNVDGGLKTLEQKACVSILKAGSSPIREVFDYGGAHERKGLVFMDSPALTDYVITGYMASGAHLMINTCGGGEGNKMPFTVGADTPSPILPVLKMTGSAGHFRRRSNRIDFNAATVIEGKETIERAAGRLLGMVTATASGKRTRTEEPQDYPLNIPVRYPQP